MGEVHCKMLHTLLLNMFSFMRTLYCAVGSGEVMWDGGNQNALEQTGGKEEKKTGTKFDREKKNKDMFRIREEMAYIRHCF